MVGNILDATWTGQSSGDNGKVEYTRRCGHECAEDYSITIDCQRSQGKAELTIAADSFDAGYGANSRVRVIFDIDGTRFNLQGTTDEGGLFGPIPTVELGVTAPLIGALSSGKRFKVFFEPGEPVFEGHLAGSGDAIREACGT